MGQTTKVDALFSFERDQYFLCYETERDPSPSANAHVLAALLALPPQVQLKYSGAINKVTNYLQTSRNATGYWQDKWHLSPYYATVCSTLALAKQPQSRALQMLQPTLKWLLQTQQISGGWRCGSEPTLEETAYALQSLKACSQFCCSQSLEAAIFKGQTYLRDELSQPEVNYPKLWRGKELYTPIRVVKSAVYAALH